MFGFRGGKARWSRPHPPVIPEPLPPPPGGDEASVNRTKNQVAKLDEMIDAALDKRKLDDAATLAGIKARLWPLAQPTAGSLKPGRVQRQARPEVQPTPTDPA